MIQTIYILWLRQLKKYIRSKSRIIGSLGQPILFLVAFGFGFQSIFQKANGGDYLQFLSPGIIAMSILFTAIFAGIELIWDRQFGFLKETLVAPVPRWHIMVGRTLGGATVATIQGLIVFVLALFIGFRPISLYALPIALVVMFLIALVFTAIGTAIACMVQDMQAFPIIMNFLVMPLFFLSGALFPLEGAPGGIALVAKLDPLSYGVDGLRQMLTGVTHFGLELDFLVLISTVFIFLGIGSYLFSRIEV